MARPRVPPGYHFAPTPEELVHNYLDPWITGQPLGELASVVCVADVYGCEPATLTERFREFGHDGQYWYFLCVTKWKVRGAAAGRVMNRVVDGGGCWQNTRRAGTGQHFFNYRDADDRNTRWLMEEFCSGLAGAADGAGVKVICKVYLSPRALTTPPIQEERQHVGTKRPATTAKEERREDKVVEDADNLGTPVPYMGHGAASKCQETVWLQYGGVFIKMEELKPLIMVRPNGEVLRFDQPAATDSPGATVDTKKY